MIKLIATDMDGTLLDPNHQLPVHFFDTLELLNQKDVLFVVASGRPYPTLYENFQPHSHKLHFICDNGAYIAAPGKSPIINPIDPSLVQKLIQTCEDLEDVHLLLCGVKNTYYLPCEERFQVEMDKYYIRKMQVPSLYDIDDEIFKVTLVDLRGAQAHAFPILKDLFSHQCNVVVSGPIWLDVTNLGVNKGVALRQMQKDLGISYEETMSFGDFYNDIEMLQASYYSFVMENANEDMKQYGNFIAKSNADNGVLRAIEAYVL